MPKLKKGLFKKIIQYNFFSHMTVVYSGYNQ